jgi:predicted component of type VI protein secretion system
MYVALAMPPFLLREPYDSTTAGKGLSIREEKHLWGAASVAAATTVARRFAESGWPTLLTGQGDHQLEEMPLWKSEKGPIPLSAVYTSGKQGELADSGFTVLGCLPGKDHVYLQTSPTASRLRAYDDDETTERARALRSLDAQLFVSRIAHFLLREQAGLPPESTLSDARAVIENRIQNLLGVAGKTDAATYATVEVASGDRDGIEGILSVAIQSPATILLDTVRFQAQVRVGMRPKRTSGDDGAPSTQ